MPTGAATSPTDPASPTATGLRADRRNQPAARSPASLRVAPPVEVLDLTVGVVSFHSMGHLRELVPTWQAGIGSLDAKLIVLENGTGEDLSPLSEPLPNVEIRYLQQSIPFTAAVNRLLRCDSDHEPRSRYVALLNPDTTLLPGALERLVEFLDDNPEVGAVGPRVWDLDSSHPDRTADPAHRTIQRSWRRFPTLATALFHRHSVLARLWPGNPFTRRYVNADRSPDHTQDTDWLSGCCLVVRADLYARIGGLDERFPMFCEDVDLCRQVHAHGFRVVYLPTAAITHAIGGSWRQVPLRSLWLRHRSMTAYVLKYRSRWNPLTWLLVLGIWSRCSALATLTSIRRLARRPHYRANRPAVPSMS